MIVWRIVGLILAALFYGGMWTFIVLEQRADNRNRKELAEAIMQRGRIFTVVYYEEEQR